MCWKYEDTDFPPTNESLGNVGGDHANATSGKNDDATVWVRASDFHHTMETKKQDGYNELDEKNADKEIATEKHWRLFDDDICPDDICQGALGDCWLLAALSVLAQKDGAIQARFVTKEYDPRGKYTVRLFDGQDECWRTITVDDFIPIDRRAWETNKTVKPKFSQAHGNELWVLILEKAFAKLCGSYAKLEGGSAVWALRAMTGDLARCYMLENNEWHRYNVKNTSGGEYAKKKDTEKKDVDKRACGLASTTETYTPDAFFQIMKKYDKIDSLLSCGGASNVEGLHPGHAYGILDVKEIKSFRMIQIRNPWGTGEWTGAWSDNAKEWEQHPEVAKACKFNASDDGAFWMIYEDFLKCWKRVGILDRTTDIHGLKIDVTGEGDGWGPMKACCRGCFQYWCCCLGCKRLYCANRSTEETQMGCLSLIPERHELGL